MQNQVHVTCIKDEASHFETKYLEFWNLPKDVTFYISIDAYEIRLTMEIYHFSFNGHVLLML